MTSKNDFPTKINRHVIQSYIFSNARARFNIVQMRIIYRLVEFAQCELEGLMIKDRMTALAHNLRHVDISLPIQAVLPEGSKHYEQVRKALKDMETRVCEFYDTKTKTWHSSPLIYNIAHVEGEGVLHFSVADFVWDAMLDFTHGFRQYELTTVLNLHSAHSMKMYTLLSGQTTPIQYSIDALREVFGVGGRYKQSTDFVRKIIEPCRKELDAVCPYSFTYRLVKESRAYVAIVFFPYEQTEKRDAALVKKQLIAKESFGLFYSHVYNYMRYSMDFSPKEIKSNQELLEDCAKELPDILSLLSSINGRRRGKDGSLKGKGWVISALRSELAGVRAKKV